MHCLLALQASKPGCTIGSTTPSSRSWWAPASWCAVDQVQCQREEVPSAQCHWPSHQVHCCHCTSWWTWRPSHTWTWACLDQTLWSSTMPLFWRRTRLGWRGDERLDNSACHRAHCGSSWVPPTCLGWAPTRHPAARHRDLHGWHESDRRQGHQTGPDLRGPTAQRHSERGRIQPISMAPWQGPSTSWWTHSGRADSSPFGRPWPIWTTSSTASCSKESLDLCRSWCQAETCPSATVPRHRPPFAGWAEVLLLEGSTTGPLGQDQMAWTCQDRHGWVLQGREARALLAGLQDAVDPVLTAPCACWLHCSRHPTGRCSRSTTWSCLTAVQRCHKVSGPQQDQQTTTSWGLQRGRHCLRFRSWRRWCWWLAATNNAPAHLLWHHGPEAWTFSGRDHPRNGTWRWRWAQSWHRPHQLTHLLSILSFLDKHDLLFFQHQLSQLYHLQTKFHKATMWCRSTSMKMSQAKNLLRFQHCLQHLMMHLRLHLTLLDWHPHPLRSMSLSKKTSEQDGWGWIGHETMQFTPFGPMRRGAGRHEPYPQQAPPADPQPASELFGQAFAVDDIGGGDLPKGWSIDEHGYFQLNAHNFHDYWEIKAGCLIRHHLQPRHRRHDITKEKDCPFDLKQLDPVRVTMMRAPNGTIQVSTDRFDTVVAPNKAAWTGLTVYQLTGAVRKELAMYATTPVKRVARQEKHAAIKKKASSELNERGLTMHEREQFMQAKIKELRSFFENGVWEFSSVRDADPQRTLTSRMLLKWSKNPDGSPRAKARLVVRGYNDQDALEGKVETSAPTTSRLSRSMFLSLVFNLAVVWMDSRRCDSILTRTSSRTTTMGQATPISSQHLGCWWDDPNAAAQTLLWTDRCTEKMVSRSFKEIDINWAAPSHAGSLLLPHLRGWLPRHPSLWP